MPKKSEESKNEMPLISLIEECSSRLNLCTGDNDHEGVYKFATARFHLYRAREEGEVNHHTHLEWHLEFRNDDDLLCTLITAICNACTANSLDIEKKSELKRELKKICSHTPAETKIEPPEQPIQKLFLDKFGLSLDSEAEIEALIANRLNKNIIPDNSFSKYSNPLFSCGIRHRNVRPSKAASP